MPAPTTACREHSKSAHVKCRRGEGYCFTCGPRSPRLEIYLAAPQQDRAENAYAHNCLEGPLKYQ